MGLSLADQLEVKITQAGGGVLRAPSDFLSGLANSLGGGQGGDTLTEFLLIGGIALGGGVVLYLGYRTLT